MHEIFVDKEVKVVIALDEIATTNHLINYLADEGVFARAAKNGDDLKALISTWKPDFVIIDLFYSSLNALMFLKNMRQADANAAKKMKVFVTSKTSNNPQNVKECMKWGAADYLVMPLKHIDVLSRIILHIQEKREVKEFTQKDALQAQNQSQFYIHLTDLTLKEAMKDASLDLTLHNLTKMVAMAMKAVRVSIVECDLENQVGIVHGSSDNRDVRQLKLALDKYPEIIYTIRSGKTLAIDNLSKDPTMKLIGEQDKSISFTSIIVAPIETPTGFWGVISGRMPNTRGPFEDIEIQFVQLVSHVVSMVVQKNQLIDQAKKTTPAA